MSDAAKPPAAPPAPPPLRTSTVSTDAVVGERSGRANVHRMHAVWRCADCGYTTDCCGW